ncbi:hypothetical protein [Nostoc sp. NMS4]|nr:hypothetical protein [Nostoc sp. NMS4]MBN3922078.1 hypothetical protein [Nostoc sp. NMS4]
MQIEKRSGEWGDGGDEGDKGDKGDKEINKTPNSLQTKIFRVSTPNS